MFTFELTDNYILIYNHKTKEIIKEEIPYNIISNNKIYDYLKLNKIIIDIINKYKLLNSLFKTKINILIFENKTPTEIYLLKNLFKNLSNININLMTANAIIILLTLMGITGITEWVSSGKRTLEIIRAKSGSCIERITAIFFSFAYFLSISKNTILWCISR